MALLDISGASFAPGTSSIVQPAVGGDARTAPTPDAFVSTTVAQKLDADLYAVTDAGDNSEGLAGSGNLNHALLQAQQNDLLANTIAGEGGYQHDTTLGSLAAGIASDHHGMPGTPSQAAPAYTASEISETSAGAHTHAAGIPGTNTLAVAGPPAISSPDIAADSAPVAFSGSQPSSAMNGLAGAVGAAGPAGQNGTNGTDGTNGTNGANGTDGTNGTSGGGDCCGPVLVDIDISVPVSIGPICLGDIINGPLIDLGDVTTVVTSLTQNIENITTILPDIITTTVTHITDVISPLLDPPPAGSDTDLLVDLGIAQAPLLGDTLHVGLDAVEQVVGDIDITLGIDGVLQGDTTDVSLDVTALGATLPDIGVSLPTSVEDLLNNPAGEVQDVLASLPETIVGAVQPLVDGLLAPPSEGSDTDLLVDLGIAQAPLLGDTLRVGLDAVEQVVGDIDITLGIDGVLQGDTTDVSLDVTALGTTLPDIGVSLPTSVEDLLNNPAGEVQDVLASLPETITAAVQPLVDGLTDGLTDGLFDPPASGDTDLSINIGVLDEINIPLDPLESITGDLDIDVTAALDALGDSTALGATLADLVVIGGDSPLGASLGGSVSDVTQTVGGLVDSLTGGLDGGACWPTTPAASLGDSIIDSVLGATPADSGILAPVGSVAEGVGLLDLGGNDGGGVLGGLGGAKHGGLLGGLFG